ncbi:MAG: cytochrome c oxidase subunit I [Gemmatimonadota bacterium]|nr:cytochrome c oxidase subunit I [Gemmatimonadota bacterium]
MATTAAPAPAYAAAHAAGEQTGLWSWLATVDHKRIGTLYLWTALGFLFVGGIEAFIMRLQLMQPNGQVVSAELYNQLFTMHGTTMIFLVVMPLSAAFFNYLIPLQIGARDVAFPRLNAFSYWVYLFGGLFMTIPIFFNAAPDGGWFGYAPLTTLQFSAGLHIDFWVLGLQILGVSSLAAAFNFITTIINMRAPGMTLMRMPIFTWMSFVVQFLLVLAFPAITIALFFLQFDRFFGTQFYEIAAGADPLLWQHLFWVFGHPEVYILILPAFGLASEILPTFSQKPLFGYNVMVYSGIMIGFLGFGVWAHHMFAVGMGATADTIFSMATMLIGIPTGVKIFNWIATMWGGNLRFTVAMKFAIALVALFTIGGISGVMHSSPPTDLQQTDTYFIVAHFHYVLFGGSIMGIMGGIYHYYPKITGRYMSEKLGNWHFWLFFIGMNMTFFPMHFSGMLGMPRRIYTYDVGQGWETFNLWSTIGVFFQAAGLLIFAWNFLKSRKSGERAPNDAWGAGTLEWSIPSPPPEYNFAQLPVVTSRYPLWDLKHPERTADIAHSAPDQMTITDSHAVPMHEETERKSAKDLGIPMPFPTIKPLFAALFMVIMVGGLVFIHAATLQVALAVMISAAALFIGTVYGWLTSPLE